jgi:hypothetical protein
MKREEVTVCEKAREQLQQIIYNMVIQEPNGIHGFDPQKPLKRLNKSLQIS